MLLLLPHTQEGEKESRAKRINKEGEEVTPTEKEEEEGMEKDGKGTQPG